MRRKTRNAKSAAKARSAVKGKTKRVEGGFRPGSKLEKIVGLLRRPEGCTTADALKATGWPSLSFNQQARAAGLKLKKKKEGRVIRYWAA